MGSPPRHASCAVKSTYVPGAQAENRYGPVPAEYLVNQSEPSALMKSISTIGNLKNGKMAQGSENRMSTVCSSTISTPRNVLLFFWTTSSWPSTFFSPGAAKL